MNQRTFITQFNTTLKVVHHQEITIKDAIEFNPQNYQTIYSYIKNVTFEKEVTIIDLALETSFTFEKCVFKSGIHFKNCEITAHQTVNSFEIHFIDCQIDSLVIDYLRKLNRGIEIFNSNIEYINISNLELPEIDILIKNDKKDKTINIIKLENSHIHNIDFNNFNSTSIDINEFILSEGVSINYLDIDGEMHFENIDGLLFTLNNCQCKELFSLEKVKFHYLYIHENTFSKHFHIDDLEDNDTIYLNNNNFKDFAFIDICSYSLYVTSNNFDFMKANLKNRKTLKKIGQLYLHENIFKNKAEIKGFNSYQSIENISLTCNLNNTGVMSICDFNIDKFEISQDNNKANIYLNNVNFKELSIKDFSNYGNLTFSSCEAIAGEKSIFSIENSNLGKTQFYDFDFASFSKINIKNTILIEIVTANVTWFLPDKLNEILPIKVVKEDFIWDFERDFDERDFSNNIFFLYGFMYFDFLVPNQAKPKKIFILESEPNLPLPKAEKKDEKYYKNQREVYRQLKQSTDKQGDRIQSLDFQAEEMKVYKEFLQRNEPKNNKTIFNFIVSLFCFMGTALLHLIGKGKKEDTFGRFMNNDRFTLWLSQTNDFGLSWRKPTKLLLWSILISYPLLIISVKLSWSPDFSYMGVNKTINVLYNEISFLPQLFNPTRDLSKIFPTQTSPFLAHFFDILQKLVFGFFAVQIASGFRKYVK